MNRLRWLFAGLLFLLALPIWRYIDILVVVSPYALPVKIVTILWFAVFILYPFKLIFTKWKLHYVALIFGVFATTTFFLPALSSMASRNPYDNHCGRLTFTGTFYPTRVILTDAYKDDLEARNQQCWIRKMISKVPESFHSEDELKFYTELIEKKLMSPSIKYRASLPLLSVLYFQLYSKSPDFSGMKRVYDSVHFWPDHYTDEISERHYSWINWPHSEYIKFEYGLIEKNWEKLIQNIVFEEVIYR